MNRHFEWTDSFQVYHELSNEKARIEEFFMKVVCPKIDTGSKSILDIGCGDCDQLIRMLRGCRRLRDITILDPAAKELSKKYQRNYDAVSELAGYLAIEPVSLEAFVRSNSKGFDFISAIHSLFGDSMAEALAYLLRDQLQRCENSLAFVVGEDRDSFISKARHSLLEAGFEVPETSIPLLEDSLIKQSLPYRGHKITGQHLNLRDACKDRLVMGEPNWLPAFIMGETSARFWSRSPAEATQIAQIVWHEFDCENIQGVVSIDDLALVIG